MCLRKKHYHSCLDLCLAQTTLVARLVWIGSKHITPLRKNLQACTLTQSDIIPIRPCHSGCGPVFTQLLSTLTSHTTCFPPSFASSWSNIIVTLQALKQNRFFSWPCLMFVQSPVDKWFASFYSALFFSVNFGFCRIISFTNNIFAYS